jgi:hypothetical protein
MTTDQTTVRHVTFGRQRVSRGIEPRARLDAGGTRLRLRALHVMGHGSARISRALGASEDTIQRLVRGDARTVSPPLRDAAPRRSTWECHNSARRAGAFAPGCLALSYLPCKNRTTAGHRFDDGT